MQNPNCKNKVCHPGFYFIQYWLPVLFCASVIFSLSSKPGSAYPYFFSFQDKIFHALEYAVFSALLFRALHHSRKPKLVRWAWLITIAFAILYGASDEFHQLFVPQRCASIWDLTFDSIGVVASSLITRRFYI